MKHRSSITVFIATFLLSLSLAACSAQPGIQGTLKDKDNQPLSHIKVTLKQTDTGGAAADQSIYTDSEGKYQFQDLPAGQYTLTITWENNPACTGIDSPLPLKVIDDFLVAYAHNAAGNVLIAVKEFDYKAGESIKADLQFPCTGKTTSQPTSGAPTGVTDQTTYPDLTLLTFDKQSLPMSDFEGKVLVLNFWSSAAPTGSELISILEQVWQKYKTKDVAFFGVNMWDSDKYALEFAEKYAITYPIGPDVDNKLASYFNVKGIPHTVVMDKKGKVAQTLPGTKDITVESLSALIDKLIR